MVIAGVEVIVDMNGFLPLASEHQAAFAIIALLVAFAGSVMALRLFARVRRTRGMVRKLWLFLAAVIGGGTIWSTQYLALLGLSAPQILGFDPLIVFSGLLIAIGTTITGFFIATRTERSALIELGGVVVGLGVAGTHFLATYSIRLEGRIEWSSLHVILTLGLACLFGLLMTNRIARPVTRFCKYGGALAMVLAIAGVYVTGIAGALVAPIASDPATAEVISRTVLKFAVLFAILLLISTATAAYLIDITSTRESQDQVRHLTMHDTLTGLGNRASYERQLERLLDKAEDDTARTAVVVLDIDRFKEINDAHGRAAGDQILCGVSDRMKQALSEGEHVGRLGGDEFFAVKHPVYTRKEAVRFCEKLRDQSQLPIAWEDNAVFVGVSAGVAVSPDDGDSAAGLLECADLAKRRAKAMGGDRIAVYSRKEDEANRLRSALATDLRTAVSQGELELYYQQQNCADSRKVIGFEALLRWNHPERGQISPFIFIPIAEESGLIHEIGEWVLKDACREAAGWEKPYKVAVNVAAPQLAGSDLPDLVGAVLAESGLPAERLEVEITESGVIHDQEHAHQIITQLRTMGISIAMDDFGTGYSSLSTLKNIPFDKIKIDREFVKDLHADDQMASIIQATIVLAEGFGIPVLAEGVETENHLEFLNTAGCRDVQGYLFGKPMPVSDVRKLTGWKGASEGSEPSALLKDAA